jgi:hypothetical protein
MATRHQTPWWEQPGLSPSEPEFDAEREHLRAEMARSWQARLDERHERLARGRGHGPDSRHEPPAAA